MNQVCKNRLSQENFFTELVVYLKTSAVSLNKTVYKKRHKTRDLAVRTVPKSLLIWKRKVIKTVAKHTDPDAQEIFSETWCCADLIRKVSSCRVQQNDRREGNGGSRGKVLFFSEAAVTGFLLKQGCSGCSAC